MTTPLQFMSSQIDRSDLIAAIHDLAEDLGSAPTRSEMNDRGAYSARPFYNEFDGLNDALQAAGYDPNHRNRRAGRTVPARGAPTPLVGPTDLGRTD